MKVDTAGKATLEEMGNAQWYNSYIYDYFKHFISGDVLEIGCGIGNFIPLLSRSGRLTAIDYSGHYISELKKKYKKLSVGLGDIEKNKYFFNRRKFDTIVSFNVFEHIKNDEEAIINTYNLLNKKGRFVILVPAHNLLFSKFDKEIGHWRRYTKDSLRLKLERAGFEVIKINYFNWWAAIGWLVFIKLFAVKRMPSSPVKIFDKFGKFFLSAEKYTNPPFGISVVAVCKK